LILSFMRLIHSPIYRAVELVVLTIGVPLVLYQFLPRVLLLFTLWLTALYCDLVYRAIIGQENRVWWNRKKVTWANLEPILTRFSMWAIALTVSVWLLHPDLLFSFMRAYPLFWALVMVLYPLLSVIPQEIIFRAFFFRRYDAIFPARAAMVLASGLAFGAAHLIFHNWVAPALCAVGGIFFADTYARHRSLLLVSLEHSLYGCFIFTVGLGHYFYTGAIPR
jgi:membrane protease YdiL (CAAX protease family)